MEASKDNAKKSAAGRAAALRRKLRGSTTLPTTSNRAVKASNETNASQSYSTVRQETSRDAFSNRKGISRSLTSEMRDPLQSKFKRELSSSMPPTKEMDPESTVDSTEIQKLLSKSLSLSDHAPRVQMTTTTTSKRMIEPRGDLLHTRSRAAAGTRNPVSDPLILPTHTHRSSGATDFAGTSLSTTTENSTRLSESQGFTKTIPYSSSSRQSERPTFTSTSTRTTNPVPPPSLEGTPKDASSPDTKGTVADHGRTVSVVPTRPPKTMRSPTTEPKDDPVKENLPDSSQSPPFKESAVQSISSPRRANLSPKKTPFQAAEAYNAPAAAAAATGVRTPEPTTRSSRDSTRRTRIESKENTNEDKDIPTSRPRKAETVHEVVEDDSSSTSSAADHNDLAAYDMELPLAKRNEVLDSTCVWNGSTVTVTTCCSRPAVSIASVGGPQHELDMSQRATTIPAGLGRGTERASFRIVKCSLKPQRKDSTTNNKNVVRYGDTVALCCPIANNRALGVGRKQRQQQDEATTREETVYEVGFFRSTLGQAEQWTVLWGGSPNTPATKRAILVGSQALARKRNDKTDTNVKAAVRSVDCMLLRNNATGGLLSFQSHHHEEGEELTIVTHSYSSLGYKRSTNGSDGSLLSRLQRHSRIIPRPSEMFQFRHSCVPPCPIWGSSVNSRRFYLDGSFLLHPQRNESNPVVDEMLFADDGDETGYAGCKTTNTEEQQQSETRTVPEQERLLLDEVIGSMMGLEGRHVKIRRTRQPKSEHRTAESIDEVKFWLCDQAAVDTGLRNLVERILLLSSSYVRVQEFVSSHLSSYEYGSVMQALCEGLDTLLQEYLEFVSRLEQTYRRCIVSQEASNISMSSLYVEIKESLATMTMLEQIVIESRALKGGALLNELRQLMTRHFVGDEKGRRLLEFLLERASVPYMNMLSVWLETGVLQDPFGEFMIDMAKNTAGSDLKNVNGLWVDYDGEDWEDLYRLREENVLEGVLSTSSVKQRILGTGKCWNAVRYCRRTNKSDEDEEDDALVLGDTSSLSLGGTFQESGVSELRYTMDLVSISSRVDQLYRSASKALVQLILRDFSLIQTLVTLKRFFLFDQGDFFVHFLDSAEEELLKEMENVSRGRIQHWLSMCVQPTGGQGEDSPGKPLRPGTFISLKKPLFGCPLTASALRCRFASESLEDHLNHLHAESGGIVTHEPKTPSRHAYGIVHKGLTGMEAFMLDFKEIPFPTSLVVSRHALASYQLLFRHLFFAKHVERRLVGIWMDHQMMKELQSLRKAMGPTYCLRQRMLHFVQNLIYYMMFEVIEPNWLAMEAAIHCTGGGDSSDEQTSEKRPQQTVDDIRKVHNEFLQKTLKECLLTNRDFIRTLTKLQKTCLLFSDQLKRFVEETKIPDENYDTAKEKRQALIRNVNNPDHLSTSQDKKPLRQLLVATREERYNRIKKHTSRVERELSNGSYKRMISRFDEVFTENLTAFMSELQSDSDDGYRSHRANLCIRLDYNGYVAQSIGGMD